MDNLSPLVPPPPPPPPTPAPHPTPTIPSIPDIAESIRPSNPPPSSKTLVRESSELTWKKQLYSQLAKQTEANQQSPLNKQETIKREHSQRMQPHLSTLETAPNIHTMAPEERAAIDNGRWWKADDSSEMIAWRMTFEAPDFKEFENTIGGKPDGRDVDAFFHVVRETEGRVRGLEVGNGVGDNIEVLSERLREAQRVIGELEAEAEVRRLQS